MPGSARNAGTRTSSRRGIGGVALARSLVRIAVAAAVCASPTSPVRAQELVQGTTAGGAHFAIQMPTPWNGKLVIWNHGFDLAEPGPVVDVGPLVAVHLAEGFAVAASSYRQGGWALFKSLADVRALVRAFTERYGAPSETFVYGASLGGLVTVQAVEKGIGTPVAGALVMCGAVAGSRNWDAALDLRLAYDYVCDGVRGGEIPGGARGLPAGTEITEAQVEARVRRCTGVRPGGRGSAEGAKRRRLTRLLEITGVPREFLQLDMRFATFGLADLIGDRAKLRGKIGVGNSGVDYGDAGVNAGIERVEPQPGTARRLARSYTPTGDIGETRMIGLHTDGDGLVIVENLGRYAELAPANRLTTAVAIEERPSHCGFTAAETVAAWEELVEWAGGAAQPDAADLQAKCESYAAIGLVSGPCRIDADYEIGDIDDRIRPR